MTPEQPAGTAPAPFVSHGVTAHGLAPDKVRLHRDEHGAVHIFLDADGTIDIRIQVHESPHISPERHAAELERDRQGLLRLAEVATQLAEEIAGLQREGGAMTGAGTRMFHLGDILSVTTERLVSPRHIEGVYDILDFMSGESLMTHSLPRVARECQEPLFAQHPDLRDIDVPRNLDSEEKVMAWLAEQVAIYGETREVAPLADGQHARIDPIAELRQMMRPDAETVAVVVPDAPEVTS